MRGHSGAARAFLGGLADEVECGVAASQSIGLARRVPSEVRLMRIVDDKLK
jgi:hypothetical protein